MTKASFKVTLQWKFRQYIYVSKCENQNKNLDNKANAEPEDKKDTTIIGSVAVEKGMIILLFFHVGNMICMICVVNYYV